MDLQGKRVLLTGASRGIGAALAVGLAEEGAELVLVARDEEGLTQTALSVRASGGTAHVLPADLASEGGRAPMLQAAGPIDVLVNNAGIEVPMAVLDQTDLDVQRQIEVNLVAPIALTRALVPGMIERGGGAVVMISSMSGKSPTPYNGIYSATKFGLNGFAQTLRIELRDSGVHVGTVCPSFVASAGMWADWGVKAPGLLREVPLDAVVRATKRVIKGAPEVLVTPSPMRPFLALGQLFPRLDAIMLRALGVTAALEKRAAEVVRRRASSSSPG